MKTRNLITVIGVVALTAMVLNLNAAERLLPPRMKANERMVIVPSVASGPNLATINRGYMGSPRSLGDQITPGSIKLESAPTTKCAVIGTPRQAGMFASCCKVTPANCKGAVATCCAK